jgi:hypothetical protein
MAVETKQAYDPMKNRPNYSDPETKRQHDQWKRQKTIRTGSDEETSDHRFCPVCDYVMVPGPDGREVCAWEPLHTPAKG